MPGGGDRSDGRPSRPGSGDAFPPGAYLLSGARRVDRHVAEPVDRDAVGLIAAGQRPIRPRNGGLRRIGGGVAIANHRIVCV